MPKPIPTYELYGDLLAGRAPDAIHLETIKDRSSKHDWTIRVHRHRRLGQVFLFRSPGVHLRLGEMEHRTKEPTLLIASPGVPHGFHFAEDVIGDVLSVRMDEMPARLQTLFAAPQERTTAIFPQSETPRFNDITTLFEQLARTYQAVDTQRSGLMTATVEMILLYLTANAPPAAPTKRKASTGNRGRHDIQAEAFCALLEDHFRRPLKVADYAKQIGLSAPHLTRICRDVLGAPPNALVRQRRMLEAKRLLEYTALSISEIADRCGFRDAAFFSRSFKSHVGVTANTYRAGLEP